MYVAACVLVFLLAYGLTIGITSIGYHRALAHGSVRLHPWARWALVTFGPWWTGFDPKLWVVMHRRHHLYSDTKDDPHSPRNVGFVGMLKGQYDGYVATETGLLNKEPAFLDVGRDLELAWPTRSRIWYGPYLLHTAVALAVGLSVGWWMALALFAGAHSHMVQGVIINYFGHAWGGRNFDIADDSRNNHPAAWLLLGEGFQNNHHRYPSSARFSYRRHEVDMGYGLCRALAAVGVLEVVDRTLMPRAGTAEAAAEAAPAA